MSQPTDNPDAELQAIAACLAALRPLSETARSRALAYLTERLAAENSSNNNHSDLPATS